MDSLQTAAFELLALPLPRFALKRPTAHPDGSP